MPMGELDFRLTQEQWEALRDGWADVVCWHQGYKEAKPTYSAPEGLELARLTIIAMKEQAGRQK